MFGPFLKAPPSNRFAKIILFLGILLTFGSGVLYETTRGLSSDLGTIRGDQRVLNLSPELKALFVDQTAYQNSIECIGLSRSKYCFIGIDRLRNNPSVLKDPANAANDVCPLFLKKDVDYIRPSIKYEFVDAKDPIGKLNGKTRKMATCKVKDDKRFSSFWYSRQFWQDAGVFGPLALVGFAILLRLFRHV